MACRFAGCARAAQADPPLARGHPIAPHLPYQKEFALLLDAIAVWDHFRTGVARSSGQKAAAGGDGGSATSPLASRYDRDRDEGAAAAGSLPTIGERSGDRNGGRERGRERGREGFDEDGSSVGANPGASQATTGQSPGLRKAPSKGAVAVLHRVAELMSSRRELLGSGSGARVPAS